MIILLGVLPDADLKLNHCVNTADYATEVAVALRGMPYEQRFLVRSLFLALDVFLVYAGNVKNEAARRRPRGDRDVADVERRIKRLQSDYENLFAKVRHKIVAHRQKEDLLTLFEHWSAVDEVGAVVIRDDMVDIYDRLAALGGIPERARPDEIAPAVAVAKKIAAEARRPWHDFSLLALANQDSGAIIPTTPMQEKLQQTLATITGIRISYNLHRRLPKSPIGNVVELRMAVIDLCSLIDNIFADDTARNDPSLLTRLRDDGHRGAGILAAFPRDALLEKELKTVRDKLLAHMDATSTMKDMNDMFNAFTTSHLAPAARYYSTLWETLRKALAADLHTVLYAGHGEQMDDSVIGMAKTVRDFAV